MLSQAVAITAHCGKKYGVIDDVDSYCNKAINDYLNRRGGHLDKTVQHEPFTRDDLLAELFAVVARCARDYEPGHGISFATYVYRVVLYRIIDWYRKKGGDRRYNPRPVQESIDDRLEELGGQHELDLGRSVALEQLSMGLTPVARMTLRKVVCAQQLGIPDDEIAEYFGWTRRQMNEHLRTLRQELPRRDFLAA